jgi:hypothetical protein
MRNDPLSRWTLAAGCAAAVLVCFAAGVAAQVVTQPRSVVRDVQRELACGAQAVFVPPAANIRILGSQERTKRLYGPGEAVVVSGGSAQGLKTGQDYIVRRIVSDRFALPIAGLTPVSIHTVGWLRVVDVEPDLAIATITDACDGMLEGDYVEEYVRPSLPAPSAIGGQPDYTYPGHVVLGDDRRQIGGVGALMVIDRGSDHGMRSGQRLTLFRHTVGSSGPIYRIGEATVAVVSPETSLVRIEQARDAVYVGDLVAIHR